MGNIQTCGDSCNRMFVDTFDGDGNPKCCTDPEHEDPSGQIGGFPPPDQFVDVESRTNGTNNMTTTFGGPSARQVDSRQAATPSAGPVSSIFPDENIVSQLVGMGFPENGAKRACIAVKNANVALAMEWVLGHSDDPDFNDPVVLGSPEQKKKQNLEELMNLGFSRDQADSALRRAKGNTAVAAELLLGGQ